MPNDDIAYLLKFAPKEAHIDDLINGQLYMNTAEYYHDLPGEQGDPLEVSLTYGMGIYANWLLPIYCMFAVRKSDIVDNAVVISKRMIEEFRRADGWIGIVRYDRFRRLLKRKIDSGNGISLHASVFYGIPAPCLTGEALRGIPHDLVIKTPKYAYQKEYRIIGARPVECRLLPDENHPGCVIEEYGHAVLDLGSRLKGFFWKFPPAEAQGVARRPHVEAPVSRIANEARTGRRQWQTSQQSTTPPPQHSPES